VQPIHYSLIYNFAVLMVMGALAWKLDQPLLLVVALLISQHALERFRSEAQDKEEDEAQPMGFLQDVDGR
jgi:hypothetical protein